MLLSLLVYGYANGVFSSRKIERATYDSVAFRFIAAGTHLDHDTLATFRRRFLDELANLFVQVLEMVREMKLLKLGTLTLYGTKVKANASRHSAASHGHIEQLAALPQSPGQVEHLLADTGFYSAKNVGVCEACSIDRFIAVKRDEHHPVPQERFTEPAALPADATPAQTMAHKLKKSWQGALRPAQINRRARVVLSPVLPARPEESHGRMDAGLPRVEFEAQGHIASAVAKTGGNRASLGKNQQIQVMQPQLS